MIRYFLILSCLCFSALAANQQPEFNPHEANRGGLWVRNDDHAFSPASTLQTDVSIDISGMVVRAVVKQTFCNSSTDWMEGIYAFPLPTNAAVDHFRMRIGNRVIEGQIKKRVEAKKIYTTAKNAGKKSSLIEQERPNIFTTSVANIGPNEIIEIEIEYQQIVDVDKDVFSLRFPLVIAPRYIPGTTQPVTETIAISDGFGWAPDTDQVPDASRITPPVFAPDENKSNAVSLKLRLTPGFPLERLESPYHDIDIQKEPSNTYLVSLKRDPVPADRDFKLVWQADTSTAPKAVFFSEKIGKQTFSLLMLLPPDFELQASLKLPREMIFVIDTSGSMHGDSIKQAKRGLQTALTGLQPEDSFNIIQFNSSAEQLFQSPRRASQRALTEAFDYVDGLNAEGGTEMLSAMRLALQNSEPGHRLRQVIFLTDGAIGNEEALFGLIHNQLGKSRLFPIGIGSAPNSHFMRKAAQFGRGIFTHIGDISEVQKKVENLLKKIESPALTDIRVQFPDNRVMEQYPSRIPDLYLGQPVMAVFRTDEAPKKILTTGMRGDVPWQTEVRFDNQAKHVGVAVLWARKKIADLMDRRLKAKEESQRSILKDEIISTALSHHLVSQYTSLVAVDLTPTRNPNTLLKQRALKTELPNGWTYERVFRPSKTATPAQLQLISGMVLLLLAIVCWKRSRQL